MSSISHVTLKKWIVVFQIYANFEVHAFIRTTALGHVTYVVLCTDTSTITINNKTREMGYVETVAPISNFEKCQFLL